MIKENNQITIHANQTTVFEFLTNDENLHKWVNGIVAIKPIGEHHNGVGDAVKIDFNVPKEGSVISTLTQWNPAVDFATAYTGEGMNGNMHYQLKPLDESTTEVKYSAEHHPQSWGMKLMSPLIALVIRKERKKELQRLKEVVEIQQRQKT